MSNDARNRGGVGKDGGFTLIVKITRTFYSPWLIALLAVYINRYTNTINTAFYNILAIKLY